MHEAIFGRKVHFQGSPQKQVCIINPPTLLPQAEQDKETQKTLVTTFGELMLAKHFFKQFLLVITILMPFAFAGTTYADTAGNDLNADFIKAAFSGNLQEVERLLAKGANINAKRDNGTTALIGASIEGHQDIVELLLAKEANVDTKVYFFGRTGGATACDLAAQKGHQEIVKLLVRAGAFYEGKMEAYQQQKAASPESNQPTRRK